VIKQEEPCEGRLSSTVPWEGEGEIPLPDPIASGNTASSYNIVQFSKDH